MKKIVFIILVIGVVITAIIFGLKFFAREDNTFLNNKNTEKVSGIINTLTLEQSQKMDERARLSVSDPDQDGLSDFEELQLGRNPRKQDFSFNGVDTDHDGVPDEVENWLGTNPQADDTDGDGLGDMYALESIQFGIGIDTDNDLLPDYAETKWYGTDPNNPDTDGDGYKDGAEVLNGYNPKGEGKL